MKKILRLGDGLMKTAAEGRRFVRQARHHLSRTLLKKLMTPEEHAREVGEIGEETLLEIERLSARVSVEALDFEISAEAKRAMLDDEFAATNPEETTGVERLWKRVKGKIPLGSIVDKLRAKYPKAPEQVVAETRSYILLRLRLLFIRELQRTHPTSPPPPQTPGKGGGDGSGGS